MVKHLAFALLLLTTISVFGAAQEVNSVTADMQFPFFVGKTLLPAGAYHFTASANLNEITVSAVNGKQTVVAPVLTRLSKRSESESAVVFDVDDAQHHLSEIYMAGIDGFLVPGANVRHTHINVKAHK